MARRSSRPTAALPRRSISVTFKDEKDGTSKTVKAPLGKSLLEVAHENDIDLEGEAPRSSWRRTPRPSYLRA